MGSQQNGVRFDILTLMVQKYQKVKPAPYMTDPYITLHVKQAYCTNPVTTATPITLMNEPEATIPVEIILFVLDVMD